MNIEYWEQFYKTFKVKNPSEFAKFCLKYIDHDKTLIDIGCGTGRDTYYFAKNGIYTIGVDIANKPKDYKKANFVKSHYRKIPFARNQIYARFFLHAIENLDVVQFIQKCSDLLMLEFRNFGDNPIIYPKHFRNYPRGENIFSVLVQEGFEINFYEVGHGLAVFKNEDPLICRIIATKKY